MLILNVAAGNQPILDLDKISKKEMTVVINIDKGYLSGKTPQETERILTETDKPPAKIYCCGDAWEFLERTHLKFDYIAVYRYLEHIPFTQVSYFIYLLYRVSNFGGIVDIVVPDYEKLAKMILEEDVNSVNFEKHNILVTTELLNEAFSPHTCIWTKARLQKFFELEKYFKTLSINDCCLDGRDIYIRALFQNAIQH